MELTIEGLELLVYVLAFDLIVAIVLLYLEGRKYGKLYYEHEALKGHAKAVKATAEKRADMLADSSFYVAYGPAMVEILKGIDDSFELIEKEMPEGPCKASVRGYFIGEDTKVKRVLKDMNSTFPY
jgi:hypothetical protein